MPRSTIVSRRSDYKGAQRWPIIQELLALGFSMDQITATCGFSKGSIQNDLRDHGGNVGSLFPDRVRNSTERYRVAFNRFAGLVVNRSADGEDRLYKALEILLEIDRVRAYLRGAVMLAGNLEVLVPQANSDQPWVDLVAVIEESKFGDLGRDLFVQIIDRVNDGSQHVFGPEDPSLLFSLHEIRTTIRPIATPERLELLKNFVSTPSEYGLSELESKVIVKRYGLGRTPPFCFGESVVHSLEEVGTMFGMTRERIRQIECKAMRKLRYRYEILAPLRPYAESAPENRTIMQLTAVILDLQKQLLVYEPLDSQSTISSATNELLDGRCDELDLSVRTANNIHNAFIDRVGQLIQCTEYGLLKSKNFGRGSLREVKELLSELGLCLGTVLPALQAAKYQIHPNLCLKHKQLTP